MKKIDPVDKIIARRILINNSMEAYKPVGVIKKIMGYSLIGYGLLTSWCPLTASWVAVALGCSIINVPYKLIIKYVKFYGKELYYYIYRFIRRFL